MTDAAAAPRPLTEAIGQARLKPFHGVVFALCSLIALADGFDVNAMAVAAPAVAEAWNIAPATLGPALSASLLGLAVGGALGGLIGDRYGRRLALIGMFMIGLVFTALTALSAEVSHLVVYRFFTGLGLGGTIPLGAVLLAEYMPAKSRGFLLAAMFAFHPLGGVLANGLAPFLIENWGWRGVFLAGGIVPLAIAVLVFLFLSESPQFLAARGDERRLRRILDRLGVAGPVDLSAPVAAKAERAKVSALFTENRAVMTLLLWLVFLLTQANLFLLASWMPVLLKQAGFSMGAALHGSMLFQLGGVAGTLAFGALGQKMKPAYALAALYVLAGGSLLAMGDVTNFDIVQVAAVTAGIGAIGAQLCLNAFSTMIYPAHVRATGLGWALSVGRIGSIVSPLVVGGLLAAGWSAPSILHAVAILPALALVGVLLLSPRFVSDRPAPVVAH